MNSEIERLIDEGLVNKKNLKTDSREVREGDVFFALKGETYNGHDYIDEAVSKGASFVICELKTPEAGGERAKLIRVEDTREELAHAAKNVFGDPSGKLEIYGVTGTNGKTTTVFLIDHILSHAGKKSGFISTVFTKGAHDDIIRSSMTTPGTVVLNSFLSEMVSRRKEAVALEVSSHALSQKRISGVKLCCAVFTNISPEHLDYHGNMENYFQEKSKIFNNLKKGGTGVLNMDDPMLERLLAMDLGASRLITFGISQEADFMAEDILLEAAGTKFNLKVKGQEAINVNSPLIGKHNVYNMMAAAAALFSGGLNLGQIKEGLESAPAVPGRLDAVTGKAPFDTFVDYAHTPGALENVLQCLRSLAEKRLICVFGCGGDRDKTKRPVMGGIASEICDSIILTNDNPRGEDPEDIVRQIEKGMPDKTNYSIILRRDEAIRKAMKMAGKGDIVVIAGKGHEDYQITGDKTVHFDDKEVAGEILKELGYD